MQSRSIALRGVLALVLAMGISAAAVAQANVDPDADVVVRSMSNYLGSLNTFTVEFDADVDHVTHDAEKLQFSAWGRVSLARPDRVYVERQGGLADVDIYYDGRTITVHGRRANVFAQLAASGTVGDAVDLLRAETGFQLPGGDLLFPDVYDVLMVDLRSGAYWGTTMVEGVECHYVAFRAADVDLQLWIRTGPEPLPMKLVLTSKWFSGAPQYSLRLRNWRPNAPIDPSRFAFSPPPNATKLDAITSEIVGDPGTRN